MSGSKRSIYENKKISEIAQILGENENTVKSRMYRAFKKMKLELEQEGALLFTSTILCSVK